MKNTENISILCKFCISDVSLLSSVCFCGYFLQNHLAFAELCARPKAFARLVERGLWPEGGKSSGVRMGSSQRYVCG